MDHAVDYVDSKICVCLIDQVSNGADIKTMLIDGRLSATLLNCKHVAAHKAMHHMEQKRMATKTIYSEILYQLFPARQISQAFKVLGMQTSDTCCVAVTVGDSRLDDMKTVIDAMTGCQTLHFEENISKFHSIPAIRKTYKIQDTELSIGSISDAVACRIASKDFTT